MRTLRSLIYQVQKNKERLKLEQGDDTSKDTQISRLIELERIVSDFVSLPISLSLSLLSLPVLVYVYFAGELFSSLGSLCVLIHAS